MSGILETILANQERILSLLTGGNAASVSAMVGSNDDDDANGVVATGDVDQKGVVWNAEMCSSNKKMNADGRWQRRKGVDKGAFDAWHTSQTFNAGAATGTTAATAATGTAANTVQTQQQPQMDPNAAFGAGAGLPGAALPGANLPNLAQQQPQQLQRIAKPEFQQGYVLTNEDMGLVAQYHIQEHGEQSLATMLQMLFRAENVMQIGDAYKFAFYQYATYGKPFTPEFCQQLLAPRQ